METVTVIMPTYNDEKYIEEAVNSCLRQKGVNIQLIVIDDGSTDQTQYICTAASKKDSRILYIRQENKGQLNAILVGTKYIIGNYVTMLHSGDRVFNEWPYFTNVRVLKESNSQGVYSDLLVMDGNGNVTGKSVVKKLDKDSLAKLLWLLGSNFISDPFFVTKDFYLKNVVKTYVVWNMPYWLVIKKDKIGMANLTYIDQPWYVYRVYHGNYIRSDVGKFEVFNGCARTVLTLSMYFNLPFKGILKSRYTSKLGEFLSIFGVQKRKVKYDRNFDAQIRTLLENIMRNYQIDKHQSVYYEALLNFYSDTPNRDIRIIDPITDVLYLGKDSRTFYKHIAGNSNSVYKELIRECFRGPFNIVTSAENYRKISLICNFLNITPEIRIQSS